MKGKILILIFRNLLLIFRIWAFFTRTLLYSQASFL